MDGRKSMLSMASVAEIEKTVAATELTVAAGADAAEPEVETQPETGDLLVLDMTSSTPIDVSGGLPDHVTDQADRRRDERV